MVQAMQRINMNGMGRRSKLLSKEVVELAATHLNKLGRSGMVAIKLRAIISADNYGITQVAGVFGTTKTTLISWIKHVKEESLEHLSVQKGRGRKSMLSEAHKELIKQWMAEDSQITIDKVKGKIMSEAGVNISRTTVYRMMKAVSFSYITPRPKHYKQSPGALTEAKKNLAKRIESLSTKRLFFMDEARFGTHSRLGHGWFPTGSRSIVKVRLGFENFYVYGAVEPDSGETFSLTLPKVNTDLMSLFLKKMSEY